MEKIGKVLGKKIEKELVKIRKELEKNWKINRKKVGGKSFLRKLGKKIKKKKKIWEKIGKTLPIRVIR